MVTHRLRLLLLALLCPLAACSSTSGLAPGHTPRTLTVPAEMKRKGKAPKSTPADKRYVVRLADRGRVWELELPDGRGGYEMRVPLGNPEDAPTEADEELMADAVAEASGAPEVGADAKGSPLSVAKAKAQAAKGGQKRGYLAAVANVSELYSARKYELALIEVGKLEKDYPQDARLHSMKGSLYLKLGKKKLARASWEKALTLNPSDLGLAEALRELSNAEESP